MSPAQLSAADIFPVETPPRPPPAVAYTRLLAWDCVYAGGLHGTRLLQG